MSGSVSVCLRLAVSAGAVLLLIGIISGGVGASTPHALRETCQANIVETIPTILSRNQQATEIHSTTILQSILDMINRAQRTIKIATWFIALSNPHWEKGMEVDAVEPGKQIMEALEAAASRGVRLVIVVGRRFEDSKDLDRLAKIGLVHHLERDTSLGSGSEMQSKFILVDEENFYIGSTDLVWFSLSLNKSLGITFTKCKSLAKDLNKIFHTYVMLAESRGKPVHLPDRLDTAFNLKHPMNITIQDHTYKMFLSSSPGIMNDGTGRTSGIDALLNLIENAREFIYVSVPDYSEKFSYTEPKSYWPVISSALKRAAFERGVRVRLLFDWIKCERGDRMMWVKSLAALSHQAGGAIMPRVFKFPEDVYARYKNDDYVLTERGLYLGTGSWMPDFFTKYATTSLVIEPTTTKKKALLNQVEQIFWRDYFSWHSQPID